jgi:NAD-dependent deacetylase
MKPKEAGLKQAKDILAKSKRLCILTGAGISAESGIKTFRDAGGLWEDHPVEKVATPQGFTKDPKLVWRFYNARRKAADVATPNAAHLALARLELGRRRTHKPVPGGTNGNGSGAHHDALAPVTILTQNIDGLHQQAGSQNVIELHGSIWKVRCTECEIISSDLPIEVPILPYCEECDGLLRPHVVWFGEDLDTEVMDQAEAAVEACDAFLVIGTSAVVEPAASFPVTAAELGVPLIEINMEPTPITKLAEISLHGKAGDILPKIVPS